MTSSYTIKKSKFKTLATCKALRPPCAYNAADLTKLNDIEIETFIREFRLTSNGTESFDWMVGGFFFDETVDYTSDAVSEEAFRAYADFLAAAGGGPNACAGVEQAFGFKRCDFDQEIKDFQSNIFLGTRFNLQNAGSQSTKGLEFDSSYYFTDAFRLNLAGTFLDPNYDSFENSSAGDLTGEQPAGIREVSISLAAQYEFLIARMEAYVRSDYPY